MVGFIIIGSQNAVTYKDIFPHIKNNKLWLGTSWVKDFVQPNGEVKKFGNICWYTNIPHKKRIEELVLYKEYSAEKYPKYDNYDAIEVSRTENIPMDYDGIMGVPITFLDKYCPTQFEIIKFRKGDDDKDLSVNGKCPYFRILIRRKKAEPIAEVGKKFLIIGNQNAIIYKEIFPYIKNDELWLGASIHSGDRKFYVPDNYPLNAATCGVDENGKRFIRVKGIRWFTNLTYNYIKEPLILTKTYNSENYPKYDNYDAINIDKTADIPMDYDGVMGVPITFLDKYCPTQFEIVDARDVALNDKQRNKSTYLIKDADGTINGKPTYARILIRRI